MQDILNLLVLTPEEREAEQARYLALAEQARTLGAQPDCGLLVLTVLMFIGASPGSTGGGIKTSTFFTAITRDKTTMFSGRFVNTKIINSKQAMI